MNASSQNSEALPSELSPVPPPMTDALRAAYATYGAVFPVPAGSPAAAPEEAPAKVTTLQAAAAVMDAEMKKNGTATGEDLAEAERTAGILFDAESVQAAVDAAREQARTECAAELAEARQQLGVMAGTYRQLQAVLRLCEGRKGDDLLLVASVVVAAEQGSTAVDGLPMSLEWTRTVNLPESGRRDGRAIIECISGYGGRADLELTGEGRQALASLLDAEIVPDIYAPCPHSTACGRPADELDESDPAVFGWARLDVAGVDNGPAWYCSPSCVSNALARAGALLAAADDMADDLDARYGPGASDEYALQMAEATEAGFEGERGDADEDGAL